MKSIFIIAIVVIFQLIQVSIAQDCSLIVPPNPLSADGLATPYYLVSNDPAAPCSQTADGATFVQGAVINTRNGEVFIYNPLVIDVGTSPAIAPVVPDLPKHFVVALWFGTNGDSVTLIDNSGSLNDGNCVNGISSSIFGQYAYCNAPAFFIAANIQIQFGNLNVPRLGQAKDGDACPTSRDFFIVDQDQSDNVVTSYLITQDGTLAQNTAANRRNFPGSTVLDNGSDEGLVVAVDSALGCSPWTVTDLADPSNTLASLPMNELLAAYKQQSPIALVPALDPMVLDNNGNANLAKVNLYRIGVDQHIATSLRDANTKSYCRSLGKVFATRMMNSVTKKLLSAQPSVDDVATNLYTFMAARFENSFTVGLNCTGLLNTDIPVIVTWDKHGKAVDATVDENALKNSVWDDTSSSIMSSSAQLVISISFLAISLIMAM